MNDFFCDWFYWCIADIDAADDVDNFDVYDDIDINNNYISKLDKLIKSKCSLR